MNAFSRCHRPPRPTGLLARAALLVALLVALTACHRETPRAAARPAPLNPTAHRTLPHLDHSAFFTAGIKEPQAVTRECLRCHKDAAAEVMQTAHWTWISGDAVRDGKSVPLGKKTQLNNYCISIVGNWASCTICHAGYGWKDEKFDFNNPENVDCLACHDGSGTYAKTKAGLPQTQIDLRAVAASVRRPQRDNCGSCHFNGGGGVGVKHGDLDDSLLNGNEDIDLHMGRLNFQCVDCHQTHHHRVPGKVDTTYTAATPALRFDCEQCHQGPPHRDPRLNQHTARVACQTCHIPEFARKMPTKMTWDWSQAGDAKRPENVHEYLKIKGSFTYEENVVPEYAWYNGKMDRYVVGDKITSTTDQAINQPLGSRTDPTAKIWPFKIHRAKQPFDPINRVIVPPITSGEGGFWTKFDWDFAVRKGAEFAQLPYSGRYDFLPTHMYWPITHMTAPAKGALTCTQCHGPNSRLNWQQLGYAHDPVQGPGKATRHEDTPTRH